MKKLNKIISLILIQTFLVTNIVFADGIGENQNYSDIESTLSPQITLSSDYISSLYDFYIKKQTPKDYITLSKGRIKDQDIIEQGVVINAKTTNFKIGKNSFRLPPYLSQRVARVHITEIDEVANDTFYVQKMGIGAGRRKQTTAVILADLNDQENQVLIFEENKKVFMKSLGQSGTTEEIKLGKKGQFNSMSRQDSFLERSVLGINFLNQVLGIGQEKQAKPRQAVQGLTELAVINPKLKKDLPISLAFFSQDYLLSFSENLVKHSHVAVLRDREQRGRFIAIVDKLNPDNRVVFERRGDKVFVLGENEQEIIPKLEKHKKAQVINFTDLAEGARFCRNVSRDLLELEFADNTHSMTMRKNVQLNVGVNNPDVKVLKANQFTQATFSGYQRKQKKQTASQTETENLTTYPVYILPADFDRDISVRTINVDFDSEDYIFFNPQEISTWPQYLSFGSAENSVYYQHVQGAYTDQGQAYTVYKAINRNNTLTALSFSNDQSFSIRGINWKDGKQVVFRNIQNIALANIVTQLSLSEFIDIDPVLAEHFNITGFSTGTNPMRSTYKFVDGVFEQAENIKMQQEIDFSDIQKAEDKKIKKNKKSDLNLNKAAFFLSALFMILSSHNLFAAESMIMFNPQPMASVLYSSGFLNSLITGLILVGGIMTYRIVVWLKKKFSSSDKIEFKQSRRDFITQTSISGLIGFLVLQTGLLVFIEMFKDMNTKESLIPRITGNLMALAMVYEKMPDIIYTENKRLALPMSSQYWQLLLKLNNQDAEKATAIYMENFKQVLTLYAQPDKQLTAMNASQLLMLIAERIQGKDITIQEELIDFSKQKNMKKKINFESEQIKIHGLTVLGAAISPIAPIVPISPLKQQPKQPGQEKPGSRVETEENDQQSPNSSEDTLSVQAKLLSANYALIEQMNNSADEQGRTYFSLKNRLDNKQKSFVIRIIDSENEIDVFQQQLAQERNFKWKKIFSMIEYFRAKPEFAERFCIYGVFVLDEYGKEQQLVAAADYIVREIDGKVMLNGGHIEILPQMRKAYSGIGKSLFTKVLSDAFTLKNLKLTKGRMFFIAENKGKGQEPVGFYKDALGLRPKIRKIFNGKPEETNEFELSAEESLAYLRREFLAAGFSPKLKRNDELQFKTNDLVPINLRLQKIQLVGQAI